MNSVKAMLMGMGLCWSASVFAVAEGEMMPAVEIKSADGKTNLNWKGKTTVLNFWATWCEACKVELKEMNADFTKLHARSDAVVGYVSLDKEPEKAKAYLEEVFGKEGPVTKRIAHDSTFAAADKLGVDSFPMTLVIDKTGKIVKIQRGFKEGEGSTKNILKTTESL